MLCFENATMWPIFSMNMSRFYKMQVVSKMESIILIIE